MILQQDRCSSLSQTMKSTHTWKVSFSFLMHRHTNGSKECQAARFAHQLILHPSFPLEMLLIKNCGSSACQLSKSRFSKHNNVCRRISGCWKKPNLPYRWNSRTEENQTRKRRRERNSEKKKWRPDSLLFNFPSWLGRFFPKKSRAAGACSSAHSSLPFHPTMLMENDPN